MRAGIYTARAGDQAYGYLDAMVAAGDAIFRGEGYDPEGRKHIVVEVPSRGRTARRNPARTGYIRIGAGFCTNAIRSYTDWKEKWWREAIQNSVDAGARNIRCYAKEMPGNGRWLVSCEDDGIGMDEDVIIDKFLVLGGSTKEGIEPGECTGGFGKAKELLILPWISWSIESGNVVVKGKGGEFVVEEVPSFRRGVKIEVVMPPDEHTHESAALAFIGKCYLPKVTFTVNGRETKANLRRGSHVRSFAEKADLYYAKKESFYQHLLVRINGLYMFYEYLPDTVPGTAILELRGRSIDLLKDNRDDFADRQLNHDVSEFISRLATDAKAELREKKGLIRKKFKGKGKFTSASTEQLRAAALEAMGGMLPRGRGPRNSLVLSQSQQREIAKVIGGMGGSEQSERPIPEYSEQGAAPQPAPPINLRTTVELVKAMLDGLKVEGTTHMEAIAKAVSWEPDFYLYNNLEGWKVPKRFYPEKMSPNVRKLLRFWAELCRFILIKLNSEHEYGVGFVFDEYVSGMHVVEDNEKWLLLNPFRENRPSYGMLSLADEDDVDTIFGIAVHEVTHMADGISYHSESYASALTKNLGKLRAISRQVERIRKAIVSRGPLKGPRLENAQVAEDALIIMQDAGRWMNRDEINAEIPNYLSVKNAEALEAKRFVEARWDDDKFEKQYSVTDAGFNWAMKRVETREKKAAKRRTA